MGAVIGLVVVGALAVAFVVSLTLRRHGESDAAQRDWTATSEVFKDPTTERIMRVWLDSAGQRHYVAEK
ncbi:MAG: hypothetical protein HIU57_04405 [Acidobacteria bacterium]|nr:hypothetical protein [Acidobacteriota bacterium]